MEFKSAAGFDWSCLTWGGSGRWSRLFLGGNGNPGGGPADACATFCFVKSEIGNFQ